MPTEARRPPLARPLRVLLCSAGHWWNAEAAYAATQAELLRQAGLRVWVLTRPATLNAHQLERRHIPLITRIPLWSSAPWRLWPAVASLRRFLRQQAIDVVNVFRSRELLPAALACGSLPLWPWPAASAQRPGAAAPAEAPALPGPARNPGSRRPSLLRTRGSAQQMRRSSWNRRLQRAGCDGFIAPSRGSRKDWAAALELPPQRIHCIYLPAPPAAASGQLHSDGRAGLRRRLARELALDAGGVWLVMVGRIAPEKGHEALWRAFARLRERHPQAALLVCAKDDGGALRQRLQALAGQLGIAAALRILGFRQDLQQVVAAADIGVIPSLASEVNCRVALEFFAAGLPTAAFPTGTLPELISHGASGLLAQSHTPQALAEVLQLLAASPSLRQRLGRAALKQAHSRFAPQRFLNQTLDAFTQAMQF